MNKDFTHHHSGILERVDRDVPFVAEIRWAWSDGDPIEPGSSRSTFRGWACEDVRAWVDCKGGLPIYLSEVETACLLEECHPDALRDGFDHQEDEECLVNPSIEEAI